VHEGPIGAEMSIPASAVPRLHAVPRQTQTQRSSAGECRQCRTFCDKLVDPAGCLEMGCKFLYTYEDVRTGGRFMGCMNKVFSAEIDFDLFLLAERAREGFGGIKMTGTPLPHCQFSVERAYEGDGPGHECVNRRFFDAPDDTPESIRAFDLRNSLS
jgi:hypothetical protein